MQPMAEEYHPPTKPQAGNSDFATSLSGYSGAGAAEPWPLPSNEAAEQALLGAILINNDALDRAGEFLKPEHFFCPAHGRIYAACQKLREQNRVADPVTLRHYFERDGDLKEIGGAEYLLELAAGVVSVIYSGGYAQAIYDLHLRRQLVSIGHQIIADARSMEIERSSDEIIGDVERKLFEVTDRHVSAGLVTVSDAVRVAMDEIAAVRRSDGRVVGVPTGLADLDAVIGGMHPENLIIIAGRPGMAKSTLALNIARRNTCPRMAKDAQPVAFYSLEMANSQLGKRLIAMECGVPLQNLVAGPLSDHDVRRAAVAAAEISMWPLRLDEGRQRTVGSILLHARRLQARNGLALIIVDYLQLMVGGKTENRVQEVSRITRDLKMLAGELKVPVLALSQLSRKVEERDDKRPLLSDLRESGSIEQDADVVLFLYRQEMYLRSPEPKEGERAESWADRMTAYEEQRGKVSGLAEIIVAKNRHGRTDTVRVHFNAAQQLFSNLARGG